MEARVSRAVRRVQALEPARARGPRLQCFTREVRLDAGAVDPRLEELRDQRRDERPDRLGPRQFAGRKEFDPPQGPVDPERPQGAAPGNHPSSAGLRHLGGQIDPSGHRIEPALNRKPKYVASNTLTEPRWADTTVLSSDVAAAVRALKAKLAGGLQVHGSGALIRWLLDNQLVDEITLLVCPVIVGQGARPFPDTGPDIALDLVDSRVTPKRVTIQIYRPTGRPQYETATPTPRT